MRSVANICCVGDDDQSIYGWRGAEVDNILRFEKDFPGAKVIRLERNYRSTPHILAAASHLIAHNEGRLGKTLFTDRADPEAVRVSVASSWDSEQEARAVGEEIEQLQRKGHTLRSSRDIKRRLEQDGWQLERVRGSHHVFRNPATGSIVVLPHPKKDLGPGLVRAIYRQAGWRPD